jgi:hypothetical protein
MGDTMADIKDIIKNIDHVLVLFGVFFLTVQEPAILHGSAVKRKAVVLQAKNNFIGRRIVIFQ